MFFDRADDRIDVAAELFLIVAFADGDTVVLNPAICSCIPAASSAMKATWA